FDPTGPGDRHQYPRHQWFEKSDRDRRFHIDRDLFRNRDRDRHRQVPSASWSVSLGETGGSLDTHHHRTGTANKREHLGGTTDGSVGTMGSGRDFPVLSRALSP